MKIARGFLKVLALVGGALVTFLSLMAVVGTQTGNGWARAGVALVVTLLVPLILVEIVLSRVAPDRVEGVTTDVLALTYVGFALAFVGMAHAQTRPLLQDEGQRLAAAGMTKMSRAAYFLAGGVAPASAATTPAIAVATPAPDKPAPAGKPAELRAGDGKERTPAQIFSEFAPSVVTVMVKGPLGEGGGTGFIIDDSGTIGTNFHVIDNATEIKIKLIDGTMAEEVEVLAENQPGDLALLHVKSTQKLPPVALGDSDKVTVGERAVSIGNPLGLDHTLTDGLISSRRMLEGRKMIQMSTPVSPGNSGGPLFNSRGEVIGISTAIFHGGSPLAQNLNLATPIDDLRAMIRADYPGRHKVGESRRLDGREVVIMRNLVTALLIGMLGAFGALLYLHHEADSAVAATSNPATTPVAKTPVKPTVTAAPALHRTLRTVSLGWEFLAPGVISNDGGTAGKTSAYKMAGLDASFTSAPSMDDIESALAKGGAEPGGADIAIVPLSSYVASFERLRALSPEIVFVVGWSRGREALYAPDVNAFAKLPASGPIKLAAGAGQPETFLALFMLDLAGVPASRVELVDRVAKAPLTALFRTTTSKPPGKLLITSADTPHLMPIVAVVPHGFIEAHGAELETWGRIWLSGVTRLQADVPSGGRQVASISGAPPVLAVIEALGQIEFASLRENAAAAGLSGRGALTLDEIFKTTWRVWRDTGVVTTPPPEVTPLHTGLISALVRTDPKAVTDTPRSHATTADTGGKRPEVLIVVRAPVGKLDAEAFVTRIGFLAGVFDRLPLRIGVKDDPKTATLLLEMARDRFGLRPAQLSTAKRSPPAASATVEILSST